MKNSSLLNRVEHYLLGSVSNADEPLWIVYREVTEDIEGISQEEIAACLDRLVTLGFVRPSFNRFRRQTGEPPYEPLDRVTKDDLMRHFEGRSEEELRDYPFDDREGEYFFEITAEGRAEETKKEYDHYYPDVD